MRLKLSSNEPAKFFMYAALAGVGLSVGYKFFEVTYNYLYESLKVYF